MIIYINDQEKILKEACSLSQALNELSIDPHGIAIASGERIIPKKNWDSYQLGENEQLTIIRATCGG